PIGLSGPGPEPAHGVQVPLVGRIAAGAPILAAKNIEEYLSVPSGFATDDDHFALRVAGASMIEAGILDGDVVVIHRQDEARDGEIVAAVLPGPAEDEATVKRLRRRSRKVMLEPANAAMEPFPLDGRRIAVKVVRVP